MTNKWIYSVVFVFSINSHSLPVEQIQEFDLRYQLQNTHEKLVDNLGNNFEDLYGVRNFRVVLKGLVYRGGANNRYNKYKKRSNMNPLPEMGLNNLCQQGFHGAVYLYTTNFDTASKKVNCKNSENKDVEFNYQQITAFDEANTEKYLSMVYDMIHDKKAGPLYIHCWNGWHASGLISALMLRQFCDRSGEEALAYWIENTDGNNDGYEAIKARIKDFVTFEKFKISKEIQEQICY